MAQLPIFYFHVHQFLTINLFLFLHNFWSFRHISKYSVLEIMFDYGIIFAIKGGLNMGLTMQLVISIIVPIVTAFISYLAAVKKSNNEIKAIRISADNEIQKIKEKFDGELKMIQKETDEQIRLKIDENELLSKSNEQQLVNSMASEFFGQFIESPQKSVENLINMQNAVKRMQNNK